MTTAVQVPKYEPRCERCGHGPGVHTTTSCANYYRALAGVHEATCDCSGWKRDEGWPPPIVVGPRFDKPRDAIAYAQTLRGIPSVQATRSTAHTGDEDTPLSDAPSSGSPDPSLPGDPLGFGF